MKLFLILSIFLLAAFPIVSLAQNVSLPNPLCCQRDQTTGEWNCNPNCQNSTIPGLIESILSWLKDVGAVIAGGMIVFGAFQILFAGGDPERFSTGRRTILYAVIGYVIIWVGWGLTSIIQGVLTTSP